jgi:hypothetical protein
LESTTCSIGNNDAALRHSGRASVLYTFCPPLLGSAWYYCGATLLADSSMIWVGLMIVNMAAWNATIWVNRFRLQCSRCNTPALGLGGKRR